MQTVEMKASPGEARERYLEYLAYCKTNPGADVEAIKRAYRELSLKRRVIDAAASIVEAGLKDSGLPRLAIARADWKEVYFGHHRKPGANWRHSFHAERWNTSGAYWLRDGLDWPTNKSGRAIVPTIPPRFHPGPKHLAKYAILFEAEWLPIAPVDPYLLRPLGRSLYSVVAHWDLTDVERAVLGFRLQ